MALSPIPGVPNLYMSGLFTIRRKQTLADTNITHIVTVLRGPLNAELFKPYKHLVIEVDDVEDENLLEHFATSNAFIQDGLDAGGGVLVHCAMGKSRSTTLIISYLLTQRPPKILSLPPNSPPLPLTPTTAISLIRQSRPMVEPNPGFMQQLELYYSLGCPADVTSTQAYKRWRFDQEVRESVAIGRAPEQVRFEDDNESNGGVEITPQEHSSSSGPDHDVQKSKRHFEYRCRKCRHSLSATPYLVSHTPKPNPTPLTQASNTSNANPSPPPPCAHIYTQPLLWMKPELSKGNLNGRLNCPKCNTNVGKYAWQGLKCSCGAWMVPAITLARTRVDEVAMTRREGAGSGGAGLARNGSSSDVGHVHEQEKGDTLKQTNDELARSRERLRNLGIRMPPNVNVGKM